MVWQQHIVLNEVTDGVDVLLDLDQAIASVEVLQRHLGWHPDPALHEIELGDGLLIVQESLWLSLRRLELNPPQPVAVELQLLLGQLLENEPAAPELLRRGSNATPREHVLHFEVIKELHDIDGIFLGVSLQMRMNAASCCEAACGVTLGWGVLSCLMMLSMMYCCCDRAAIIQPSRRAGLDLLLLVGCGAFEELLFELFRDLALETFLQLISEQMRPLPVSEAMLMFLMLGT